ncbi:hypothetical protein LR013_04460 [candidate division NPL-UPA2 bacterium]|nr:hypothetical protein [candidate division NPL-UPA2 bacterium]
MIRFIFKLLVLLTIGSGVIYWLSNQNILNVKINRVALERFTPPAEKEDADWVDLCIEIRALSRSALELSQKLLKHLPLPMNDRKELENGRCYIVVEEEN